MQIWKREMSPLPEIEEAYNHAQEPLPQLNGTTTEQNGCQDHYIMKRQTFK